MRAVRALALPVEIMCGKFTQMMSWGELHSLAAILGQAPVPNEVPETVTPMRFATLLVLDNLGRRNSVRMRWGFVPSREKTALGPPKFIHARAETIDSKPTFRDAFAHRRGLLIVESFNEGEEIGPRKTRQYVLRAGDSAPVAIAAIWERWSQPGENSLLTFAMVTVPPNALIGTITERMPALLPQSDWPKWLGEEPAEIDELKALLRPYEGALDMVPSGAPPPPPRPGPKRRDDEPSLF